MVISEDSCHKDKRQRIGSGIHIRMIFENIHRGKEKPSGYYVVFVVFSQSEDPKGIINREFIGVHMYRDVGI